MMVEALNSRHQYLNAKFETVKKQLEQLDRTSNAFLERVAEAGAPALIASYETKLREIEEPKLVLRAKLAVQKPSK